MFSPAPTVGEEHPLGAGHPEPQEDMMDNTAGSQPRGLLSTVGRRLKAAAPWILLPCVILLAVITGLAVHYKSANKHLQIRHDNLVLELETRHNNQTLENEQLQCREAAVKPCPCGWQRFGFSCYSRSTEETHWEDSRKQCGKKLEGADLVIIDSKEEQEFIKGLTWKGASWIGLNNTERGWTWVDGTALITGTWASGRPENNKNHNCVMYIHNQGNWKDVKCEEVGSSICEMLVPPGKRREKV